MDEDEDATARYLQLKREISDAKIRLATADAQAKPFGFSDPEKIAQAIRKRFEGVDENGTIKEKRAVLFEVIEEIMTSKEGLATFMIRGGNTFLLENLNRSDGPHADLASVSNADISVGVDTRAMGKTLRKRSESKHYANLESSSWDFAGRRLILTGQEAYRT
jgi:hypothetical protein